MQYKCTNTHTKKCNELVMNMTNCQKPERKIFDKLPFEVVDPKEDEFPKLDVCEYYFFISLLKPSPLGHYCFIRKII